MFSQPTDLPERAAEEKEIQRQVRIKMEVERRTKRRAVSSPGKAVIEERA